MFLATGRQYRRPRCISGQLFYFIRFGKKVAIPGKMVNMIIKRICIIKKGTIPLKIVPIGMSGAHPEMTKTLIPTGGVICPISIIITMITPNQMGSNPA